ncbi:methyltransferase domain-containing protein [Guyparkeria sp. SB14A]|uniref:class I SAM-dependent methyltransferase n=1 Tax=Guyparkeria sp. SB14A TaxID=2571147 RepID=UPI0010AC1553|nr:methyltransferase domain-containing protein [Guyparkeria sp. SB14A]TKA90632.1 methyltransferase domain-containing protein [Guyparkeria sp. SB14A]
MNAADYDQWYRSGHGQWIGERETALIRGCLSPRSGESLLDVGCGTGFFTRALGASIDGLVVGADIDADWLAYARDQDRTGACYERADARALPHADKAVDLVTAITVLDFIDEDAAAVAEMVRVARRRVVIGVLNRNSLLWWQKGRDGGRGGYAGARWYTPADARRLFEGLPVARIRVQTAIVLPGGGRFARWLERRWPAWLPCGGVILLSADCRRD